MQIWKLKSGLIVNFFRHSQGLVETLKLNFRRDFQAEVFCCWCLVEVIKLNLHRDSEARFGKHVEV